MPSNRAEMERGLEPARPGLIALLVFLAAALLLCWPMLSGQFIGGPTSDQYVAGYGFRHFAADYWKTHHSVPLWNPHIFGGMPFVGGMHGDIFYPTAWLRWIMPTGAAMNLGFAIHLVLAGVAAYALLRALRVGWAAAVTGGVSYQLTGLVASMVSPGHDGKMFVSALAPLLFLALLRAIRHRSVPGYAATALVIGLALHGHPQMTYYLLIAAAIWAAYLVFGDEAGPKGRERYRVIALGVGAVALGMAVYAIQAMPFAAYIPFSPRAEGGPSSGWEYATGYALPPAELFSTFYPEINGILDRYSGTNFLKHHTEHLGLLVILLAIAGMGGTERRRERLVLGGIALLFLLVAFGGHTPFYRLWYEVMPRMKQVRAAGMAFYLVALPIAVYAGLGAERLLRGEIQARRILVGVGVFAVIGLLGALGALEGIAMAIANPQAVEQAVQNAEHIRQGGLRVLLVALGGGAVLWAIAAARLRGSFASAALIAVVVADLWSVERRFFHFDGTAEQLFGDDALTSRMKQAPLPFRVWDPKAGPERDLGVYPGSWLMGVGVPQLLGYHGNELRNFDEVLGGKNIWENQVNLALLQLFAVRFVTLAKPLAIPGFHQVLGPVATTPGRQAVLYEADTVPPYARLMSGAVKVPEAQVAGVVLDPRFPVLSVAVYGDSAPVTPDSLGEVPAPATATTRVIAWESGKVRIAIEGADQRPLYLVLGENWYKDWRATVDGAAVPVLRAQHTLLSVLVPPGAREVAFEFVSPEYARGRMITLLALGVIAVLLVAPRLRPGPAANG
jgi:hypothetical protein